MILQDRVNTFTADRDDQLIVEIDSSHGLSSLRFLVCDNPNLFLQFRAAKAFCKKIRTMQVKIDGRLFSSLITQLSKLKASTATETLFNEMMDDLAKIAIPLLPQFRARDIAFTLHALSKASIADKTIFETAGKTMLERFHDFSPKDISMILCAFSRLGLRDMECFDLLGDLIVPELDSYDSSDLSGVIYSFATFQGARKNVLAHAATAAIGISSTFNSQDMTRLLRWLSKAGRWDEQLGEIMAEEAISIMNTFSAVDVSHMAATYAKENQSHPKLFHAISKHVIQTLQTLNADDLNRIFHSFATLNQGYNAFYDELASAAILIMGTFKAKHLNGVLCACCKLQYHNVWLFNEIAESSILNMDSFGRFDLKLLATSFSRLQYYHTDLITKLGRKLVSKNGTFQVGVLIHVMDGFANMNLKPSMLDQLNEKCENVIPILDTAEQLTIVKSLFCLQVKGDCIDKIVDKISKNCPQMTHEDIIAVAKTFTTVRRYKKTHFWTELGKEILLREDTKWTAKDLGILSSAFGSMSLSFCAERSAQVVSMCFKQFQLKDSSEVTIQDAAAVSSAIPFGHWTKLFPVGFIDHMLELVTSKAQEARYDDVRCVLINFSQIDLSLSCRRKFLGTYRDIFHEVSLFLHPEDCKKITKLYTDLDQIRDDSTWANNFSFSLAF